MKKFLVVMLFSLSFLGVLECSEAVSVEESSIAVTLYEWFYYLIIQPVVHIFQTEMAMLLLFAFFGGMLLNVMPCVLPVISIKLFQLIRLQEEGRKTLFRHTGYFSLGILVSFWVLALLSYTLQAFGKTVGWGFQLQEPLFVGALVFILFILTLSLFGVFELGIKVASFAGELEAKVKRENAQASSFTSFISGVFATLIATPCTGPLLGSAIGFAATLKPAFGLLIFTSMGIGMAFPYLLISCFPRLLKLLPAPGAWMETFKQLMGFFLLGTVLWLLWVLAAVTTNLSIVKLLVSFFFVAFGLWIYGKWCMSIRKMVRIFVSVCALLLLGASGFFFFQEIQKSRFHASTAPQVTVTCGIGERWEPYSLEKLTEYQQKGIPVFLDFYAKWCLLCETNSLIIDSQEVKEAFIKYGVVKMLADWTNENEAITMQLRALGRNGVPVYALYGKDPNAPPKMLSELISKDMIIQELQKVSESTKP